MGPEPVRVCPGISGDPVHRGIEGVRDGKDEPPGAETGAVVMIDSEDSRL